MFYKVFRNKIKIGKKIVKACATMFFFSENVNNDFSKCRCAAGGGGRELHLTKIRQIVFFLRHSELLRENIKYKYFLYNFFL